MTAIVRTRPAPFVRQTGFVVGDTDVRFGVLIPPGVIDLPDWSTESDPVIRKGAGIVVIQFIENEGPRTLTRRLFLPTVEDADRLHSLVQQTGTLTLIHGSHSAFVPSDRQVQFRRKLYDLIDEVTLAALTNRVVSNAGTVEVDATFWLDA